MDLETVKIELYSEDGKTLHAEGRVPYDKIADKQLVERNGHTYVYNATSRVGVGVFVEAHAPLLITEF